MNDNDQVRLVTDYIAAVQHARASNTAADWDVVRRFVAPDITVKMASQWTDEPWRVVFTDADAMIERLHAPINASSSLTTENVNVERVGDDVLVEQLSTITDQHRRHVSMVCHIFNVADGLITGIRAYRNDSGLPPG